MSWAELVRDLVGAAVGELRRRRIERAQRDLDEITRRVRAIDAMLTDAARKQPTTKE